MLVDVTIVDMRSVVVIDTFITVIITDMLAGVNVIILEASMTDLEFAVLV